MDYLQAIVLGIIQGLTEWLPVSSKSMVSLAGRFLFNMDYQESLATAIWLHSGTLLAAMIYFRKDLIEIIQSIFRAESKKNLLVFLLISTAITGVIGLPLLFIALNFEIPDSIFTLMIGILLIAMGIVQRNKTGGNNNEIEPKNAIVAGIGQGLAAIPGISRSGTTLAALLGQGFSLKDSLRLSFLMSIPAVAGIELSLPLVKDNFEITMPLLAGSIASAIVGILTIDVLLKVASRKDFYKITLALGLCVALLGIALL